MSEFEIKFQKSEIFYKCLKIWKIKNQNIDIQYFLKSNEYRKELFLWIRKQEKDEYIETLYNDSLIHYRNWENKLNQREEKNEAQIKNLNSKIQEIKPTLYFFSAMFTLFLTMVSAITIKINIVNLDKFKWWETMGIIAGIIFAIFFFAILFYLIAWGLFLRHWKKLDL